jgi:hypothetical protein
MVGAKQRSLRALWRAKMHVEPYALDLASASTRARYGHIWEAAEELLRDLEVLPLGLLRIWENGARGHIVFTHRRSVYQPGLQEWQGSMLDGVCYLSLDTWRSDPQDAWMALLNLVDHLLGSDALAGGPWFSDGAGLTASLGRLGASFQRAHALGYGHQALGIATARQYFAATLWLYLRDSRRLQTLDPLLYKLYHFSLMREDSYGGR